MTVAELKKALEEFPDDMDVYVTYDEISLNPRPEVFENDGVVCIGEK